MNPVVFYGPVLVLLMFTVLIFLQVGALRFLESRIEHRKGFYSAKSGILRPWRRTFLLILRSEYNFKRDLPALFELFFYCLAAALLPSFEGIFVLRLADSIIWFIAFIICAAILSLLIRWRMKEQEGWVSSLARSEHQLLAVSAILLVTLVLASATGTYSFEALQDFQHNHGWLLLHNPEVLPAFLFFLFIGRYAFGQHPFDALVSSEQTSRWSLKNLVPYFQQMLWAEFVVTLFLGGVEPVPALGSVLFIFKSVFVWIAAQLVFSYFITVREDQGERFVVKYALPLATAAGLVILAVGVLR